MAILRDVVEAQIYAQQNQPKFVTATYQMKVHDYSVVTDSSALAFTITLPSVAEARGLSYMITFGGSGTNVLTVEDKNGDAGYSDQTLNAVGENLFVYSNGERWIEIIKE